LLARDRQRIHYGVGLALENLYPGRTDEIAELLALHYGNSDDPDKAVDYTILAAEKAQRRWANSEALSYFDTALRRLDAMPDTAANRLRRVDAVLKQIEVKLALGQHAEHAGALAGIRDTINEIDDPHRRATWHYWMGFLGCLTGGRPAEAIDHCREAAAIAAAAGFDELDGDIQSCLAQAYTVAGDLRAAIEAGERAVSIFEARGNRWYASRALWHLSTAANYLGKWEESLGLLPPRLRARRRAERRSPQGGSAMAHRLGSYPTRRYAAGAAVLRGVAGAQRQSVRFRLGKIDSHVRFPGPGRV
jgi:tetratricopeptide (TPR) repeat protein